MVTEIGLSNRHVTGGVAMTEQSAILIDTLAILKTARLAVLNESDGVGYSILAKLTQQFESELRARLTSGREV